ncbi:MAG: M23 family metallopeptidase, partial [Acidobacteriota bacterium]|nr:M23 family metallopeptidase [Acidobacteriota bacterium]
TTPPPPTSRAVDPAETARRYTAWFYAGELDKIWDRFSPEMRQTIGGADKLRNFRDQALAQLGVEQTVLDERVRPAGIYKAYERRARFTATQVPMLVQWTLTADGTVAGFFIRPQQHEADSKYLAYETRTPLHLPFRGIWTVGWGGRTLDENGHAFTPDQRFAYDFVVRQGGTTHQGDGTANDQYYCFSQAILAPGPGRVVEATDGVDENRPGELNPLQPLGNHVVLDHGNGEYSFLAHFQKGSVAVKAGDTVKTGDLLGRCGNTGNASEPHLHYHLQDTPRFGDGNGMPAQFLDYTADARPVPRGEPRRGQLIHPRGSP